ncbi:dienelactone hydrolase family protein [Nodosilinea sp. LEGE 07088]|uniref:dienelactone hydrolase family protein n=1 Tax=Nodosilinea sp. LEGE 07088 TaxID=2777968 RepID=UPI001880F7B6|nr:dienelactone hydrolase family protein [Nodosilinea sp. LEGE 07088]MBE9136831.1 dienelactone hydrolase family protein [Nodosilinea sp. LEGE 07088]
MQIQRREVGLTVDDSLMRLYVAEPVAPGQYPGILFYSDIYQLGGPILRLADRLASYGYVVAAPEIFHRLEPIGTVIEPNDLGRLRGNDAALRTAITHYDADIQAALAWLQASATIADGQLGSLGFCIGGHLACRAALNPIIRAAVCCYPTGIHSGKLGRDRADTLERLGEITARLLLIFGDQDPHVPPEGRETIVAALTAAGVDYKTLMYAANHTFMRDDGYRYDAAATDAAWAEVMTFLADSLGAIASLP